MSKVILVVADHVDAIPSALAKAKEMAVLYEASLHIAHFCSVPLNAETDDVASIREQVVAAVKDQGEAVITQVIGDTRAFQHEVVWCKRLHEWVVDYVAANHPVMVIKTGHRSESSFYTPSDWHLLRECSVPVLITPEKRWRNTLNVMAAVDLETRNAHKQALNEQILDQAKRISEAYQVAMHVCYCPSSPQVLKDLGIRFPDEVEARALEKLASNVEDISERYAIPREHIHIRAGQVEKVIPSVAAENKVSLVVMGTVGRKGLKASLMGNTAEQVLSLLKSDVLALKPE